MKSLLCTTALALTLGMPSIALAQATTQTTTTTVTDPQQTQAAGTTGFLNARGETDLFASELLGMTVYARRTAVDGVAADGQTAVVTDGQTAAATDGQTAAGTDGQTVITTDGQVVAANDGQAGAAAPRSGEMMMMSRADLDTMDNIGQINEIVLSHDGQVRAIVIGIGGFLGVGEQDVAVTMDQVDFAADADNRAELYVVVDTTAEMLKTSPRYERTAMSGDMTAGTDATGTGTGMAPGTEAERTAFTAPDMVREGYNEVEPTLVTSELLTGQQVYDVHDTSVGRINDLILDDGGAVSHVIIDFGGFLGIGSSQASLGFEELTILSDEGGSDVRVYVDATREQIQSLPQYQEN